MNEPKICIVTGGTSGIGTEIVNGLAKEGNVILLLCRNVSKGLLVKEKLQGNGARIEVFEVDFASLTSIIAFCDAVKNQFAKIDFLINNAATFESEYQTTTNGYEMQHQVNYLSSFLLIQRLLPQLLNSQRPIIINTSSVLHRVGHFFNARSGKKNYYGILAYANTKLNLILLTRMLAIKHPQIRSVCYNPGAINTGIGNKNSMGWQKVGWQILKHFFRKPAVGAKRALSLTTATSDLMNGAYYSNFKVKKPSKSALNFEAAETLWDQTFNELKFIANL